MRQANDYYRVVNHLINASITANILIILILAARAFGNRVNAGWHYYIWFVLVMRLVVPYISTDGLIIDHVYSLCGWSGCYGPYSVIYNICFWSKVRTAAFTEQGIIELLENCKRRDRVNVRIDLKDFGSESLRYSE